MKVSNVLASVATIALCNASAIVTDREAAEEYAAVAVALAAMRRSQPDSSMTVWGRAEPDSPTGDYAPGKVDCPADRPTIRTASGLSANETAWLELRRNATIAPMTEWLTRMNISGFDAAGYISNVSSNASALPNIGLAVSGGGWRALMNGAGLLAAADNRTTNSTGTGQIGGLLQSATYVSGLSGGGWLVGSIYSNNFTTVEHLRDGSSGSNVWQFGTSIFEGPSSDGIQILSTAKYWDQLIDQVDDKKDAGFDLSLTDYWGRALSYQLVNATEGGPSYTFSSIALQDFFANGSIPMPFLVTDGRAPNTQVISENSTVYEISPFEIGSWDPTTYAFAPLRYVGSNFSNGILPESEDCIEGFDNVGYVMGTSSTLFNQFLLQINETDLPSGLIDVFTKVLDGLSERDDDVAEWEPNPFYGYNNDSSRIAQSDALTLTDGGEDDQNIALYPLIQPVRGLDVIFASDSSADTTYSWPAGLSLIATYERSTNTTIANGTNFPSIPDENTFINLGLNNRPTFFGCNASNFTGDVPPLIVYLPNAPYITNSNESTITFETNNTYRNAIIENGYDAVTQANGTLDSTFPTCLACAALSRSFTKTGYTVPDACTTCFNSYCWNGTLNSTTPNEYEPKLKLVEANLDNSTSSGSSSSTSSTKGGKKSGAERSFGGSQSLIVAAFAAGVAALFL